MKHCLKYFVSIFLILLLVTGCASLKSDTSDENSSLIPPKKDTSNLILTLEPIEFDGVMNQKSGICFKDVQDAENYLINYNNIYSYISQQKNVIEYYEKSFYGRK